MRSCLEGKYTSNKSPKNPHCRLYFKNKKQTNEKKKKKPYLREALGFPGASDGKEPAYNAGDLGSIPGSGRSPREGNGYPLQYSCLENPMNRRAWQTRVQRVAKSWTRLNVSHSHTQRFSWQPDTFPPFSISLPSLIFALTHTMLKVSFFIHLL